jgi:hypothetical protein
VRVGESHADPTSRKRSEKWGTRILEETALNFKKPAGRSKVATDKLNNEVQGDCPNQKETGRKHGAEPLRH